MTLAPNHRLNRGELKALLTFATVAMSSPVGLPDDLIAAMATAKGKLELQLKLIEDGA